MTNYDGRIQEWQLNATSESALDAKVSFDIREALLKLQPSMGPEWVKFYDKLTLSVLTSGNINWTDCPDQDFKLVWKHKQARLHDLYNAIHNVYSCYVPNNYFADVYREKLEQALDILDESDTTEDAVPLIRSADTVKSAETVLVQRANWIRVITLLEDYRTVGKVGIIESSTVAGAEQALEVVLSKLVQEVSL